MNFKKKNRKQPKENMKNKLNKSKKLIDSKESEESIDLDIENFLKEIVEDSEIESTAESEIN